ncbi:MAG: 6-bladed beta-propeller [Tannerella sp.]|jgi:hypothetical protein|nr:6-bladed beta-propeller [Tannerella sp.]
MPLSGVCDDSDVTERLSTIADRVTAVPLETNATCRIDRPEKVICSGHNVFVLCDNLIYRFGRNGNFQNRISLQSDSRILDYTVNPQQQQLIVLDRSRQIHFCTFDGAERKQEDLSAPAGKFELKHIACHSNALWFTFEHLSPENIFENGLLRFDLADRSTECFDLPDVDLGRRSVHRHFEPEFAVSENMPYIYSPFAERGNILRDTLYLLAHEAFDSRRAKMPFCIYPVRIGRRYLIASYCENTERRSNFLFVFDRNSRTSFEMNGFRDDFFGTGVVTDIQPLNTDGSEYYFYKTGKDAAKLFPERDEPDNPVLFFVRLNG